MILGFLNKPLARVNGSNGNITPETVFPACATLWERHSPYMTRKNRRRFAAGLDVERAAACWRVKQYGRMLFYVLRSFIRIPFNLALWRVLYLKLR